jgi:hypothetical protein
VTLFWLPSSFFTRAPCWRRASCSRAQRLRCDPVLAAFGLFRLNADIAYGHSFGQSLISCRVPEGCHSRRKQAPSCACAIHTRSTNAAQKAQQGGRSQRLLYLRGHIVRRAVRLDVHHLLLVVLDHLPACAKLSSSLISAHACMHAKG